MADPSITGTPRDMTIAELIRAGKCTPGCTSGITDHTSCGCKRCDGLFHGIAGDVVVEGTAHLRTPLPVPQPGPDLYDVGVLEVAG